MTTTTDANATATKSRKRRKKGKGDAPAGHGRLLDAWTPPDRAGGALGCITTTFALDAAFFEEHCLGRFLSLETVEENGAQYLIERETKLREAYCAVIADRRQAAEQRSLAWDILGVHVPNGCMHAKVSLLAWANAVRIIVASANLTTPGYRSNLEVFATFDFADGEGDPRDILNDVIGFLRGLVEQARDDDNVKKRGLDFLDGQLQRVAAWSESRRNASHPDAFFVTNGVTSALATLRERWTGGPPREATVVSPFFDKDPSATVTALRGVLAQRGDVALRFLVAARPAPGGKVIVQAPPTLGELIDDDCSLLAVDLKSETEVRSLHAKGVCLQSDKRIAWMIGSSNFTRAGLGVGITGNIEANVVFTATSGSDGAAAIDDALPEHDAELDELDPSDLVYEPAFEAAACGQFEMMDGVPVAFISATFSKTDVGHVVTVRLDVDSLPRRWWIVMADTVEQVASSDNASAIVTFAWKAPRPPSMLEVHWIGEDGLERQGLLSVNVEHPESLPVLEELRELSLETLLEILTMAKPLHEAVARAIARKKMLEENSGLAGRGLAELDPHKRVDTDRFLIQRTKRFARALEGLRRRLEEPAATLGAWRHRLQGPLGPFAVARAVTREAANDGERSFLLAEMGLMLKNVRPRESPGELALDARLAELKTVRAQLRDEIAPGLDKLSPDLRRYIERALQEVGTS